MPTTSSGTDIELPQETLGFSGSRITGFDRGGRKRLNDHLELITADALGFVTGGCIGMDAHVGRWCVARWPQRRHLVIVPADPSRIEWWWTSMPNVSTMQMPPDSSYRDRNQMIVNLSQALAAFPLAAEDDPSQRRSGTWQTVRMARRAHQSEPIILRLDTL